MEKTAAIWFLFQLLYSFSSLDLISTYEIKATLASSSDTTTTLVGRAEFDSSSNTGHAKFFGIRYGQTTAGENRFKKSKIYEYSQETVNVKKHGSVCPQRTKDNSLIPKNAAQSEDCLFLNIIVPLHSRETQDVSTVTKKKAVYIFIHGGVFTRGSSDLFVWSDFAIHGDFILVTINYRLGVLGFLTTDDDVMPGNLGLWDQQLAIRWVKQNIEAFGGDSSRITVGGQSAGSMSAILQSFYGGNDDLFQNTISESGSPFAPQVVEEKGLPTAKEVAEMVGCDLSSKDADTMSKEILKCLRGKSSTLLSNLKDTEPPIGPVLDNDFISKETFELCPKGFQQYTLPNSISSSFANKNLLTGFTTNDGEILLALGMERLMQKLDIVNRAPFIAKPISPGILRIILRNYVLTNKTEDSVLREATVDSILEYYTDWSQPSNKTETSKSAIRIFTEYFFVSPGVNTALLHAIANTCDRLESSNCGESAKPTYLYELHYPPSSSLAVNGDFPWFHGTRHGAELFLFADYDIKTFVKDMTETLYTTLGNFINTGNPNSKGSDEWTEFSEESQDMYLISEKSTLTKRTYANSNHYWQKYLPKLRDTISSILQKQQVATNSNASASSITTNSETSTSAGARSDAQCSDDNKQHDDGNSGITLGREKSVTLFVTFLMVAMFML